MMVREVAQALDAQFAYLLQPSAGPNANLFIMTMPDSPDSAVAVYQYSGQTPRATLGRPILVKRPRMQILVRDLNPHQAMERSNEIWDYLGSIKEQELGSPAGYFHKITPKGSPFELSPDKNNRQRVAANYDVEREP